MNRDEVIVICPKCKEKREVSVGWANRYNFSGDCMSCSRKHPHSDKIPLGRDQLRDKVIDLSLGSGNPTVMRSR